MSRMGNPLANDLNHVLTRTEGLWDELRGSRVFITGGTGFFGCWLLETLLWAIDARQLGASVVVLTRYEDAFRKKAPHLAGHPAVTLYHGDVRTFEFPAGEFSHVIHAATEASATSTPPEPLLVFDTIVRGTRRVLDFGLRARVRALLLTSSGAIYGVQPPDLTHMSEEYRGAPNPLDPASAYGEGKRAAELLSAAFGDSHGLRTTIARCFAFVGPNLPLDVHFAVGNFIRDGLRGGPVMIQGDGTPYRSYMYASDLAVWLWTILLRGQPGCAYNVGSEAAISVADLARAVARRFAPEPTVRMARAATPGSVPARYVPSTTKVRKELNLEVTVDLEEALKRTVAWHRSRTFSTYDDN